MRSLFIAIFATYAAFATTSLATPILEGVWQLTNGDHALDAGFIRHDGDRTPHDFEKNGADAKLYYDASAGTIKLAGSVYDTIDNRLVDFDLSYTGVTVNDNGVSTRFTGLLGSFDGVDVTGSVSDEQALFFDVLALGEPAAGRAWLGYEGGHFGDFHFSANRISDLPAGSVSAPGGLALLLVGAAAALYRRKRSAQ